MKLQQLRYIVEVVNHDLNVSLTAEKLFTSQPGISKQIRQLEDELGVQIFTRAGKHLTDLTPIGKTIVDIAKEILHKTNEIKIVASEHIKPDVGMLSIMTTYTQARYVLPSVIQLFMQKYPDITLHMDQGSSADGIEKVINKQVDFAIVTALDNLTQDVIALPCYHWNHAIIVPHHHPLAKSKRVTIEELASYPLVSYDFAKDDSDIYQAFIKANVKPNIVFNTSDADLIKTYVKLGIGVGIVAKMAVDKAIDSDLTVLNAGHIFAYRTTYLVFSKTMYLRNFMYDFIAQCSQQLDKTIVNKALLCENNTEILTMFNGMKLAVK